MDNPKIVGIVHKTNSPPPFIRSTKKNIRSNAITLANILFVILLCVERSGTTDNDATNNIEAVNTANTPKPPPLLIDTINVITTGTMSIRAIIIPALYAIFLSFFACLSNIPSASSFITVSIVVFLNASYVFLHFSQVIKCCSTIFLLAEVQALS